MTPKTPGLMGALEAKGLATAAAPAAALADAARSRSYGPSDAAVAPSKSPAARKPAEVPLAPADAPTSHVPLPPSRIPAAFHVRDVSGRLLFPSERPEGDVDVGLLAETLGGMLEEWRGRLEANKPSFPLGAARWGVLQMCIYDM